VLSLASSIDTFNTRTSLSIFKAGFLTNKGVFFSVIGVCIFAVIVGLWEPLGRVFDVVPIGWQHWVIIAVLSLLQLLFVEIIKLYLRIKDKKGEIV